VTKLRAGWARVQIQAGARDFSQNTRPPLEPTQPPIQLISEVIAPRWGREDWLQQDIDHSMCLALRLRRSGAIPLLPPPGLHFMDRDSFTITACLVANCVRSLTPKDYDFPLKFYDFDHPSSKPLVSKLTMQSRLYFPKKGKLK